MAFSYYTKRGAFRFGIKSPKMELETKEHIIQLIIRYVQGTLDDTGQKELLEWRKVSSENEAFPENDITSLFRRKFESL